MGIKDCYAAIPRQWKFPKAIIYLFGIELVFEIAALALYGIAQPDLYRTRLWQEGSDHGWNSNPNSIIYAYANHRPVHTPLPWSQLYVLPITHSLLKTEPQLTLRNKKTA